MGTEMHENIPRQELQPLEMPQLGGTQTHLRAKKGAADGAALWLWAGMVPQSLGKAEEL